LKPQKAPGELDHAAAVPGIAGCGEPLFPPFRAALVRRTRQAGVAGHGSAVTHRPRQHLIDEHICRFNADADNPSTRTIRNSPARRRNAAWPSGRRPDAGWVRRRWPMLWFFVRVASAGEFA
jgi:hypothetical protein